MQTESCPHPRNRPAKPDCFEIYLILPLFTRPWCILLSFLSHIIVRNRIERRSYRLGFWLKKEAAMFESPTTPRYESNSIRPTILLPLSFAIVEAGYASDDPLFRRKTPLTGFLAQICFQSSWLGFRPGYFFLKLFSSPINPSEQMWTSITSEITLKCVEIFTCLDLTGFLCLDCSRSMVKFWRYNSFG